MDTITKPRQKRALVTRARLLDAVEAIVAAEGPEAVTTTRIAAETGVAVGTIYRYFEGREALLLAAYDATVVRIVEACRGEVDFLPATLTAEAAAWRLLGRYLAEAEAIPAHSGLLRAMRAVRPIAGDVATDQDRIVTELIAPFLARYRIGVAGPVRLALMRTLVGTMVDLYLVTEEADEKAALRDEIKAHVSFMVGRLT